MNVSFFEKKITHYWTELKLWVNVRNSKIHSFRKSNNFIKCRYPDTFFLPRNWTFLFFDFLDYEQRTL
jgi:hypothetical protein